MTTSQKTGSSSFKDARFTTTHWSVVLAAGSPKSPHQKEALETLCRTYWYPLYAYLRRGGHNTDEAEERTQAFFAHILEKEFLGKVEPKPAKFRSFLLIVLRHFLIDEFHRGAAAKRGGRKKPLPLDFEEGERKYALEPTHDFSPEKVFERSWALTLLDKTLNRLETELTNLNKQHLFDVLRNHLCGDASEVSYKDVASGLGMTEAAVKVTVYRLRKRYREILRDEISQTVDSSDQIDEEMRALRTALSA